MGTKNTANTSFGGDNQLAWWKDSNLYTVYDDFTGTNGDPWDTTKWTTSGSGTETIQSNEGRLTASSNSTSIASNAVSTNIPANTSVYFEITTNSTASNFSVSAAIAAGFNGVDYFSLSLLLVPGNYLLQSTNSLLAEYIGEGYYDIYVNGVYQATIYSASSLYINCDASCQGSSGNPASGVIAIDNVRYR